MSKLSHYRNLGLRADLADLLDDALATERRNTVERVGLRITGSQIRSALRELGPTGNKAEAHVKAAAEAMALLLDEVAEQAVPR